MIQNKAQTPTEPRIRSSVWVVGDVNLGTVLVPLPPDDIQERLRANKQYLSIERPSGAVLLQQTISAALNEWDLRLMSVAATTDILDVGRNLIIVALVGADLHIRIFDASGKKVIDKAENELIIGKTLTALKKRLNPFPDESSLSKEDKQEIIRNATSMAGHTPLNNEQWQRVYGYDSLDREKLNALLQPPKCRMALAMFELFQKNTKSDKKQLVYRIAQFYGWLASHNSKQEGSCAGELVGLLNDIAKNTSDSTPRIVVILDEAQEFRKIDVRDWSQLIPRNPLPTIVLAMSSPLCKGKVWEHIINSEYKERTIVVISAADLRLAGVNIRQSGSMEKIVYDFIKHMEHGDLTNNVVRELLKCQHVVARLDNNGVLYCNSSDKDSIKYYFCPRLSENEEDNPERFGAMSGYITILVSSIVRGLSRF